MSTVAYDSPFGRLVIESDGRQLLRLQFSEEIAEGPADEVTENCIAQLQSYFAGQRKTFDLPYRLTLTDFQQEVLKAVAEIPYGKMSNYTEIARKLGDPAKVRAVGMANAKNPLLIIIPCHRVIGANGDLTGYAGGIDRKRTLLEHEGCLKQLSLF